MLAGRFASKDLPGLKANGSVEHEVSSTSLRGTSCQLGSLECYIMHLSADFVCTIISFHEGLLVKRKKRLR